MNKTYTSIKDKVNTSVHFPQLFWIGKVYRNSGMLILLAFCPSNPWTPSPDTGSFLVWTCVEWKERTFIDMKFDNIKLEKIFIEWEVLDPLYTVELCLNQNVLIKWLHF